MSQVVSVAICTPHGGLVAPEYYRRIMTMQGQFPQYVFYHMEVDLMIVGKARNILVQNVLDRTECDVLWFIDNDILIPPDAGKLIAQAMEYGMMSGLYFNRHPPYTPQMYKIANWPTEQQLYEAILTYPKQGVVIADAVGAGCLAVRRDVMVKMQEEQEAQRAADREMVLERIGYKGKARRAFERLMEYADTLSPWFEFLDQKGEDFYFCERLKAVGQMILVDVSVKCQHGTQTFIEESHFEYLKKQKLLKRYDPDGNEIPLDYDDHTGELL